VSASSAAARFARAKSPEYRRSYNRGWRYSRSGTGTLDFADSRGYSNDDAWMDGYLDAAAGRAKWHMVTCPDHERCGL